MMRINPSSSSKYSEEKFNLCLVEEFLQKKSQQHYLGEII